VSARERAALNHIIFHAVCKKQQPHRKSLLVVWKTAQAERCEI
jgi:hypothetical protein